MKADPLEELASAVAEDLFKLGRDKDLLILGEVFTCSSESQAVRLSTIMREKMKGEIIKVARAEISRRIALSFGRGCD